MVHSTMLRPTDLGGDANRQLLASQDDLAHGRADAARCRAFVSRAHWGHPLARDSLVRGLGQEEAKRGGRTESDQLELHQLRLWT